MSKAQTKAQSTEKFQKADCQRSRNSGIEQNIGSLDKMQALDKRNKGADNPQAVG